MAPKYMQMRILSLVLAFATSTLIADEKKIRANLNITEIVSSRTYEETYRALKGYNEIYPFLVIEVIQPPFTEGEPAVLSRSWLMEELVGANTMLPIKEGDDISDLKWREKTLDFKLYKDKVTRKCKVTKISEGKPTLSCDLPRKKK